MRQIKICLARNVKLSAIRCCGRSIWRLQRRTIGGGRGNESDGCLRRLYQCWRWVGRICRCGYGVSCGCRSRPCCWSRCQISVPDWGCRSRSHYSYNTGGVLSSRGCTHRWGNGSQHIRSRWNVCLEIGSTCFDAISEAEDNLTFKLTFLSLQISIWRPSSLQRWYLLRPWQ